MTNPAAEISIFCRGKYRALLIITICSWIVHNISQQRCCKTVHNDISLHINIILLTQKNIPANDIGTQPNKTSWRNNI